MPAREDRQAEPAERPSVMQGGSEAFLCPLNSPCPSLLSLPSWEGRAIPSRALLPMLRGNRGRGQNFSLRHEGRASYPSEREDFMPQLRKGTRDMRAQGIET